jgi:hypothetical protein
MDLSIMKLQLSDLWKSAGILLALLLSSAQAQTEVLTAQGTLPRFNYRNQQGELIWAMPANNVLWKLDGPANAGVIVCTAAAKSSSITLNEGGVGIRSTGFPSAKLHVGTIASQTEPGEVRIDPGNANATATIHAVNAAMPTLMILESQSPTGTASLRLRSKTAMFSQIASTVFTIRDNISAVNPFIIIPSDKNINSLVIKRGNVGLGVINPTSPLELLNGARCSVGGVWTNASSRKLKDDIAALPLQQAQEALAALKPVTYRYKAEPDEQQVGFIAEDVPSLVATKSREELSPMDVVAVLTKVVQDQQARLDAQAEQLKQQAQLLERTQAMLEKLAEKVQ